jgi:hypothetical protein
MPRLHGVRERRHQPFYDTVVRTDSQPVPLLQHREVLFGNANVGDLARTNLQVAGQLAADQTYVILAIRTFMMFDGESEEIIRPFVEMFLGDTVGNGGA